MYNNRIVLIYSGGIDSTVLLYLLINKGCQPICLGFNYGQRHKIELSFARKNCKFLNIPFKIIDISNLKYIFGTENSQTGTVKVPHGHYAAETMKSTIVPNRNMIMLSIAAAYAISQNINDIAYAAHVGDHFIYPDCRPEFINNIQQTFLKCHTSSISLFTPFSNLNKQKIIKLGDELKVPFKQTYSCYEGKNKHCGKCGTCVERKEAFKLEKINDPTEYKYK